MVDLRKICLVGCACALACGGDPRPRPDLILIVLDTVRADRLSCYGYARPTTPRIDALAARGIRFARASGTSSWTIPSHASLFTGLYPRDHGATQEHTRLARGEATLAEILGSAGYHTVGVSANPLVGRVTGLDRGFDHFDAAWRRAAAGADAENHPVVEGIRRALRERPPGRPLFLFANFMEAHHPYAPPAPLRERFLRNPGDAQTLAAAQALTAADFYLDPSAVPPPVLAAASDLYDAELAHLDGLVGAAVDTLEVAGALEHALLVVTADHGESFGEHHHLRHLFQLYGSVVQVPLILVPPHGDRAGLVRTDPVGGVDVFTTLLAAAGAAPTGGRYAGRDLLAPAGRLPSTPVFAEYYHPRQALANLPEGVLAAHPDRFAPYRRRLRSVEAQGLRLIVASTGDEELFDVRSDPGERVDLASHPERREAMTRLRALLRDFAARDPAAEGASRVPASQPAPDSFGAVDPKTAERLRELGYLQP